MSKPSNARQEALAAIDEFERTRCHGGLSVADCALLSRLRCDDSRADLTAAWRLISKYRNSPQDDQLLITYIFNAWHFALEAPEMLNQYNSTAEDSKQLRQCAETLRVFFKGRKIQFEGTQTTGQVEQVLQSLSWAIEIFDRCEREISALPQGLGLNRKLVGPSIDAKRMRFTTAMSEAMRAIFGRPLNDAVAALTNIVLETDIDADKVRGVSRSRAQRTTA